MIMLVKPFRHKTLEERAAEYGGKLNLDGEFDWGKPVGREIW
jgi:antitoxin MazE